MTMQHESHPHDERLAALAGADREATDDRALRDHVAACDRCRAVVDDVALLRSALAELPDLQPSRPLQLLPPVAAPARPRAGALGFLRRLSTPALAAGAALILVGAVGSTGIINSLGGSAAAPAPMFQNVGENLDGSSEAGPSAAAAAASSALPDATDSRTSAEGSFDSVGSPAGVAEPPRALGSSSVEGYTASAAPTRQGDHQADLTSSDPPSGRLPWLVLLGFGVVLAGGSLLLRVTVPRAG